MRNHSHVVCGTLLLAALGTLCAGCQQPPPGPPPAPPRRAAAPPPPIAAANAEQQPFSSSGTIRAWNYGPNGDVNGFTLDRNVLVMLPPDFDSRVAAIARVGSRVSVSGYGRSGINVQTVIDAQSLTINGQTLTAGGPPAPPPPGPGGPPPPPGD